jgi:hypothetical protein
VCKVEASAFGIGYACGGFADHYVRVQRNALHLVVTVQQGLSKLVSSVQPFEVSLHVVKVQRVQPEQFDKVWKCGLSAH